MADAGNTESASGTADPDTTTGQPSDDSATTGESTGTDSAGDSTAGASATESTAGTEGASSTGGDAFPCSGCAVLFTPLEAVSTATEFEINYGDDNAMDLSNTILTYRFHVETEGNAGGILLYAKNGSRQSYRAVYRTWTNFSDASSGFIEATLDLRDPSSGTTGSESSTGGDSESSSTTGGTGETGSTGGTGGTETGTGESDGTSSTGDVEVMLAASVFDSTDVVYVGLQVSAGTDAWEGARWGDTTVYLDSITFSDGASPDVTFDAGLSGMSINNYNNPIAGSAVSYSPL